MAAGDLSSQRIPLRDGRRLGFAEWGDPAGTPLFFFGGATGRFVRPPDAITASEGIRLFTVERPGFGLSDFQPNRTLLDWPSDVAQLADALGLARFAVLGASQGGPYAAACAYAIPQRLTTITLVSALAPFGVRGLNAANTPFLKLVPILANRAPWLLDGMMALMAPMARRNPERFVQGMLANLPDSDQRVLRTPELREMFIQDTPEAMRQGGKGSAWDMRVVCRPWGFPLDAIRARVFLWQGEADPNAPPAMGRFLAATIPHCEATFVPDAGHFLLYTHWRDIAAQVRRG